MVTTLKAGPRDWWLDRDDHGYREYGVVSLVESDTKLDGPMHVLLTPGLPLPGTPWNIGNDLDPWVWCRPRLSIRRHPTIVEGHPGKQWLVTNYFANTPLAGPGGGLGRGERCHNLSIENPLLEPPRISGSFLKYTEEVTRDRFGRPITYSSWEPIRGPAVEFDRNRLTLRIEQNVPTFLQACVIPGAMMDCLNGLPLWGLPRRTIKLSNCSFEQRYWGLCVGYWNRALEFEISLEGWDRSILDESGLVLSGMWDEASGDWIDVDIFGQEPDPNNPSHFIVARDREGNPTRLVLDGRGRPYNPPAADAAAGYNATNFAPTGRSCAEAAEVTAARYGPYTLGARPQILWDFIPGVTNPWPDGELAPATNQHWFKVPGSGARHIVITATDVHAAFADQSQEVTVRTYRGVSCDSLVTLDEEVFDEPGDYTLAATHAGPGDLYISLSMENAPLAPGSIYCEYDLSINLGNEPAETPSRPGYVVVQKYNEANFLLLGIPALIL